MACVYLFFRDQLQNDEKITSIRGYIYKCKRVLQLNASSTFLWGLQVSYLRSSLCAVLSDGILKSLATPQNHEATEWCDCLYRKM